MATSRDSACSGLRLPVPGAAPSSMHKYIASYCLLLKSLDSFLFFVSKNWEPGNKALPNRRVFKASSSGGSSCCCRLFHCFSSKCFLCGQLGGDAFLFFGFELVILSIFVVYSVYSSHDLDHERILLSWKENDLLLFLLLSFLRLVKTLTATSSISETE